MKIKHGMILAAGIGKRMQPLTISKPKPLIEINNISLLERAINLLINYGVQEISINIHYLPEQMKNFFDKLNKKEQILYVLVALALTILAIFFVNLYATGSLAESKHNLNKANQLLSAEVPDAELA